MLEVRGRREHRLEANAPLRLLATAKLAEGGRELSELRGAEGRASGVHRLPERASVAAPNGIEAKTAR